MPQYTSEDHHAWTNLYGHQLDRIQDDVCTLFKHGFDLLSLDPFHVPDKDRVSKRLSQLTGWTVTDAQNKYLNADEWFEHLENYRFPATNYLRSQQERAFSSLPDLFHEYFGHLPFMTDPCYADIIQHYGVVYKQARTPEQRLAISRLFWFSIEFGFIWEDGKERVLGAALCSSSGEITHALSSSVPHYPFDINRVAETQAFSDCYHQQYFVVDSIAHLRSIIDDYARQEGLEMPQILLSDAKEL